MSKGGPTYLRLDQNQINKQYHEVMLYVFIAEASTVPADGEADSMSAGSVICPGVFGVKSLDRIATFYADWHRICGIGSSAPGQCFACKHVVMIWVKVFFEVATRFRGSLL
jgi:D-arabinose 1-dehydrogenase-like Zn-dependent alcohol dehydrogenase